MLRLPSSSSLLLSRSACSCSLPLAGRPSTSSLLLPSSSSSSRRSLSSRPSPGSRPPSRSPPPRSGYGLPSSSGPRSSSLSTPRTREEAPKPKLWKHQQEITFSHGFVKKEFTPSPARQPPKQAPYGPGSGTASDPKVYLAIEQAQQRSQMLQSPPSHPSLSAPNSNSSSLPPPSSRQPPTGYGFERIDAPGFKPATSFTSGGFQRDSPPATPRYSAPSGSLRHASKVATFEGPVLRGTVEGEELPPSEFIDDHQKRRAYLPTGPTNTSYGLSSHGSDTAHSRFQRNGSRDDGVDPNSISEDDAESAAWNDSSSFRNSDISVSVDNFTSSDIDPVVLASLDKNQAFFPSPQPYSSGFNFAPIPGDVIPSSIVPANRIIPNFDPHSWDKTTNPQQVQAQQQSSSLISPRVAALPPRIVTSEWRGIEESRIKAQEVGSAWKAADEPTPFMGKKRRGDPSPLPSPSRRVREIPHPSLTLHNPSSSNLVASSFSSSSSAISSPTFDPNDPTNRYTEVSSSDSSTGTSPYVSSDPLLQPWSYDAPLPPSLTTPPAPALPPVFFKGAPRSPDVTLPAWSLRKAAHLKQAFELNGDGTTHWKPTYKVSRDKMDEMRALAKEDPKKYHMKSLAEQFGLNPEAVRRILKSKWQEKDEWEWEVGGSEGGGRGLEEGGKNSLEEDALSMAMSGGGEFELGFNRNGGELSGRGGRAGRKKLSEDDPFGDIDEVDEEEWYMSGGKEFEATTQSQEKEFLRTMALQEQGEGGEAQSSPPSTKGRRKSLLTKTSNTPFGRSSTIPPPSPPSEDLTTTPPTSSPPRRRHDARVADPSPWIIAPATPSPDARQKFESQAAAARATIERTRKILEERRANKLRVFDTSLSAPPPPPPSSAFSSDEPLPSSSSSSSSPLSPFSSSSSSSTKQPTSSLSFGRMRDAARDAKWTGASALPRQTPSSSSSSSSPPSSRTSRDGSSGKGSTDFGFGSTPRWEKREGAGSGGTWGSSKSKGRGESKPKGGEGTDVDSLFG